MIKQIFHFICAIVIAFLIVNIATFAYQYPGPWIDSSVNSTTGVQKPNWFLVNGNEGYAISTLDSNGHSNANKPLNKDGYILAMGSSHTQALQVPQDKKYTSLLNDYYSKDTPDYLSVYNIASSGQYLPTMFNRFDASVKEYPNSKMVTIQIAFTDYTPEELTDSLKQVKYDSTKNAASIYANSSTTYKIKNTLKEVAPLIDLYKTKITTLTGGDSDEAPATVESYDTPEYKKALEKCMSLIRSEYDKDILFVYHPEISLQDDGSMKCVRSETINTFMSVCEEYDIDFLDVGDAFVDYYEKYQKTPYGFNNTSMSGSGHLNVNGHKVMAQEIERKLEVMNTQ